MTKLLRPFVTKVIRLMVVTCLGGLLPSAAVAQTIVWTDANARKIQKKDVSTGAVQTIVQLVSPQNATQIQYDPIGRKLYYRSGGTPTDFRRMSVDGSNIEDIAIPSGGVFAINIESRTLYWTVGLGDDVLNYSDLNGAGAQSHTYPVCCFRPFLAVGDDLYLGGILGATKGIWRADADGSNEELLHESGAPTSAAYDPVENKIYVAAVSKIYRLKPDGTDYQVVVQLPIWSAAGGPEHVAVDPQARKLYWTDRTFKVIQRSNLDGSNVEDFITASEAGNPDLEIRGLTIVTSPSIPAISDYGLLATGILVICAGLVILNKRATVGQ